MKTAMNVWDRLLNAMEFANVGNQGEFEALLRAEKPASTATERQKQERRSVSPTPMQHAASPF